MDWWTLLFGIAVAVVVSAVVLVAVHIIFWPDVPWERRKWRWNGVAYVPLGDQAHGEGGE